MLIMSLLSKKGLENLFRRLHPNYLLIFVIINIIAIAFYACIFGEKIPVTSGLGWDGAITASFIQHFYVNYKAGKISMYQLEHMFPSFLLYFSSKLFHFKLSTKNIVTGTSILNFLSILVALFICSRMLNNVDIKLKIMAYISIFINFPVLKLAGYNPNIPDIPAMTLGILLFYFYMKKQNLLYLITALLGAFTYPSFTLLALVLYVFDKNDQFTIKRYEKHLQNIAIIFLCFITLHTGLKVYHHVNVGSITTVNHLLLPLSVALLAIYIFITQKILLSQIPFTKIYNFIKIKKLAQYLLVVYLPVLIAKHFFKSPIYNYSYSIYFSSISYVAIVDPLKYLVMNFVYFGPVIILLIANFKKLIAYIHASFQGIGLPLFLSISLLVSIDAESRHLINVVPIIIVLFIYYLQDNLKDAPKSEITNKFLVIYYILSIIGSRIFIPIDMVSKPNTTFQQFPMQSYFMNQGPWTSHMMYFIFCGIMLASYFVMYKYFKLGFRFDEQTSPSTPISFTLQDAK